MLFVTILWLCSKLKPSYIPVKTTFNGIVIHPELAIVPHKLCCIWTATRDLKQRKLGYPLNYQYGITLQIERKPSHVILLILLAGDVATNPGPSSSPPKNRTVKCLSLNARSLTSLHKTNNSEGESCSNMELFQNLVYSEDSDIIFVNETWLKKHICDLDILHSGYTIFRKDPTTRGGGVLLGVRTSSFKSVREVEHNYDLEIILAEITTLSNMKLLLCSCYRPPNEDQNWIERFNNFLGNICLSHQNIVLAGDFNLPQIPWSSPEKTTGSSENAFIELLNDHFMVQLNNAATRENKILDLVITNIPELVNINEILSPAEAEIFTDHNIINFDLLVHPKHLPRTNRMVYDYRRGDFTALDSLNLTGLITTNGDINDDWRNWKDTFLATVSDHIPTAKLRSRSNVPWMNSAIIHNIKKKNTLRRKLRKSPASINLREKFKHLRATVKRMLHESRTNYINSICDDHGNNPKRFWSLFKLKSKSSNVPEKVSMGEEGNSSSRKYAETPADVATLFNNYFTSIFTTDTDTSADSSTTDANLLSNKKNTAFVGRCCLNT